MAINPRRHVVNPLQNFKLTDRVRVLNDISQSIKDGRLSPSPHRPTDFYNHFHQRIQETDRESLIEGGNIILEEMGVDEKINVVKRYAPEVVFYAEDISRAMFQSIKDGSFKPENVDLNQFDIANFAAQEDNIFDEQPKYGHEGGSNFDLGSVPNLLNSVKDGANAVSGAVNSFSGALNSLGCVPKYHAQKLLDYGIKYKFLFVVEFHWTPPHQSFQNDVAFVIKDSTRPNITAEYEEINMYNFRTKVPKRTTYEPMTMRFYDDNANNAMEMWDAYQKALIPLSNGGPPDETNSMDFKTGGSYDAQVGAYSATYAPPPDGTTKDILSHINLFHVYDAGRKMNTFTFHNPRIQNFVLDDLTMTDGSNGSEVEIGFVYDALSVVTDMGIGSITAVEGGGMSAGSGGNGSSVDEGSGFSSVSNALGSISGTLGAIGGTVGAIGSLGQAVGSIGGAIGALTGRGNPLAKISNKITGTASAIQGQVSNVQGVINMGARGVQTFKTIAGNQNYSSVNSGAKSIGAIAGGLNQIAGIRSTATRAAKSLGSILNI
jgi:hypothetical protein